MTILSEQVRQYGTASIDGLLLRVAGGWADAWLPAFGEWRSVEIATRQCHRFQDGQLVPCPMPSALGSAVDQLRREVSEAVLMQCEG